VIVCTRDRPGFAAQAAASILRGTVGPDELIVVDQSREPDPSLADATGVRYVRDDGHGLSRSRNVGARHARHEILVFADDDVVAVPDWLSAMVRALGPEAERRVVAGRVPPGEPESAGAFVSTYDLIEEPVVYEGRIDTDPLGAGNMAIHRSAFDALGGFDERLGAGSSYPAAEDNDFGLRALEAGFRIVYAPDGVLVHRAWRPRRQYPGIRWRYGRGKGGFYAKHRSLPHMRRRAYRDVAHRVRRFPRLAVREPGRAVGDLLYVAGIATGLAGWRLAERRR
jgi:GT2 family glycosyltransferase